MKIIRYSDSQGKTCHAAQQADGSVLVIEGDIFGQYSVTSQKADVAKILAPIQPVAIVCIGLNYKFHAEETKAAIPQHPIVFMKLPNVVQNPGDPILLPTHLKSDKVDYECELAVVIGKTAKNVSRANALSYVLGYTAANDVSARDWQKQGGGGQWCRGKTFDTFCPLGPVLVTADEIPNPNRLALKTTLNGEVMQDWNTSDMIFDVPRPHRVSQRQHHFGSWHGHPHRHPAWRGHGAQSAGLDEGWGHRERGGGEDRRPGKSCAGRICALGRLRLGRGAGWGGRQPGCRRRAVLAPRHASVFAICSANFGGAFQRL